MFGKGNNTSWGVGKATPNKNYYGVLVKVNNFHVSEYCLRVFSFPGSLLPTCQPCRWHTHCELDWGKETWVAGNIGLVLISVACCNSLVPGGWGSNFRRHSIKFLSLIPCPLLNASRPSLMVLPLVLVMVWCCQVIWRLLSGIIRGPKS